MKTEIIKLSQIQVNTANPRQISDVKFQKLIASILALPKMLVLRPIVIDDMYVALGGNMRFRALTAIADMDETELLQRIGNNKDIQKKSDPEKEYLQDYWLSWRDNPTVPTIKASELTDAEQREFIIKDNVGYGDWDMEALANGWDVDELKEWGLDVADWEEDPDPDINEGDIEADEVETRCKEGDVWNLGRHRLMCGDSTSMDDVAKLMDGAVVDLFLTDPPYNVDYEGGTGLKIQNDNMEDTAFLQFLADAFSTADKTLKPGGVFYIWHADSEGYNFRRACKEIGWKIRQCLIWNKNALVLGRQDYQWKHEPCLYGWKEGAAHYFIDKRTEATILPDAEEIQVDKLKKDELRKLLSEFLNPKIPTTIINENKPSRSDEHPTMKPVRLFARLIRNSSRTGENVLDLFGGSGTSIIACEQLERTCYTMELDPKYCDVILARWEKLTGNIAQKQ